MPSATASVRPQPAHALALLLGRYITGDVAETQLFGLTDLFDDADASAEERTAFARFYLDALAEDDEVRLPKAEELTTLLALARA
jgi:hypothetical protein